MENNRLSPAKKFAFGLLTFVTVAAVAFAVFGRGPEAGSSTPGKDGTSAKIVSAPGGQGNGTADSVGASTGSDSKQPKASSASPSSASKTTAPVARPAPASPTKRPVVASKAGTSLPLVNDVTEAVEGVAGQLGETVDTVTDVVDEVADQLGLGDTTDGITGALDDAGTDLEAVTSDVLALVDDGVPLEEAVDTVLGLLPPLPLVSVLPILPAPAPSGGLLGGVLGN